MKIKLKPFEELKNIVIPEVWGEPDNYHFILSNPKEIGAIHPKMIRYLGCDVDVECFDDVYILKEPVKNNTFREIKFRRWMIEDDLK